MHRALKTSKTVEIPRSPSNIPIVIRICRQLFLVMTRLLENLWVVFSHQFNVSVSYLVSLCNSLKLNFVHS